MNDWNGFRVVLSLWLTEAGEPVQVRRMWRERLWTWPWRPWQTHRTVVPQVPSRTAYQVGPDQIVMHPATYAALKATMAGSDQSRGGSR